VTNDDSESNTQLRPLYEEVQRFRARDGREYRLLESVDKTTGIQVILVPVGGNGRVGWAYTTLIPGAMQLNDIRLATEARVPPSTFREWLATLLTRSWPRVNLQRLGLGTRLLEYVVQRAGELGCQRITGTVYPRDRAANPKLLRWYAKHGFRIVDNRGELVLIRRDLTASGTP
jgi:hypothetical protein